MSTTETLTLSDFLLARIAEDEDAAKRLGDRIWFVCDDGHLEEPVRDDDPWEGTGEYVRWADGELRLPNHHNTWLPALDPARVLAECGAKRAIVVAWDRRWDEAEETEEQRIHSMFASQATGLGTAVRALALVYADHPDYRDEWRP